ncbi:unnamed protein product [Ectocarpus sp. 4 AP-2014]
MRVVDEDTQPLHRRPQAQQQQQRRSSTWFKSNLVPLLGAVLVVVYLCSVVMIFKYLTSEYHRASIVKISEETDVSDCILLYGAFCNGNMGDVIQPQAMENLLAMLVPEQCFWYAHPWGEYHMRGHRLGEFFSGNISGDYDTLIPLTADHAQEVNRFKAIIIGGGGIFAAKHSPLWVDDFAKDLNVPIIIMGVGASNVANHYKVLVDKAAFVSGRDERSIDAFTSLLQKSGDRSLLKPEDVALVRDPVLSDKMLTDTDGTCWRQSQGEFQPLCFILPAANTEVLKAMHQHLLDNVVQRGDVFVNVFPKHQDEIVKNFDYPGKVHLMLDPNEYSRRLCACKAIISTRLHGAILGLHMGVPTFGMFRVPEGNKVPDVMIDVMQLPDQFFVINETLSRGFVDERVENVVGLYNDIHRGHRASIHAKLASFTDDFLVHARHVLFDVIGVQDPNKNTQSKDDGLLLNENQHRRRRNSAKRRRTQGEAGPA